MLHAKLRSGRGLVTTDRSDTPKVAVVDQAFVGRFLSGVDPLGKRLRIDEADVEIVGVVGNIKAERLDEPPQPTAASGGVVRVDVELKEPLPKGARPESNIDGLIQLERLTQVRVIARPAGVEPGQTVSLFRIRPEDPSTAERTTVELGPASLREIVVRKGLSLGDRIVVSDVTGYLKYERLRLQ